MDTSVNVEATPHVEGNYRKLIWRIPYLINNSQFVVSTKACARGCAQFLHSNHQLQALLCLFASHRVSHTANPTTIECAIASICALFDPHVLEKKNRQTNGTPILKTLHTTQLCLMFLNCVCVCFNFCLQGISNSWSCMRHSGIPPSEDWAIHMREIDPASMSFVCELVFLFFVSIELGSQILEPSRKGFDPSLNEFLTHLAF